MSEVATREIPSFDKFKLGFRPSLDGLRGVAIISVLAVHATYLWEPQDAAKFLPGAFVSVDVFFALSGFLITSILLSEFNKRERISLGGFYRRRALRLLPVLYAMLAVQFIYTIFAGDGLWYDFRGILLIVAYVSNWAIVYHLPQPFGTQQTWSLGVEEQFYLLYPLLLIAITRFCSRRQAVLVYGSLIGFALVFREYLFHRGIYYLYIYVQTETRLDVLMGGCLLAYLMHTGWRPGKWTVRIGYAGWVFLAALVAFCNVSDPWLYHGGYTLVAFACTSIVLLAVEPTTTMARLLATKPLQAVGRRTYSLYIMHYVIYLAVVRAFYPSWNAPERLALGLGLTVVVSEITHRVLELPILRIKNRNSDHAPPEEISTEVIAAQ